MSSSSAPSVVRDDGPDERSACHRARRLARPFPTSQGPACRACCTSLPDLNFPERARSIRPWRTTSRPLKEPRPLEAADGFSPRDRQSQGSEILVKELPFEAATAPAAASADESERRFSGGLSIT